jgi:hypothetical protein
MQDVKQDIVPRLLGAKSLHLGRGIQPFIEDGDVLR